MTERILRPWSDSSPVGNAELGETLLLLWDYEPAVFCVGRFVKTRGEIVFAATVADYQRLFHLGLDPMSPDFWTYYPKGEFNNGI